MLSILSVLSHPVKILKLNNNNNILKDKLDKLEELYSDGILTEEEFRSKRKQNLEKYEV